MSDATFLRIRRVPLALAALATVLGLMAGTASALPRWVTGTAASG